jgi:hypothetical protein
MYVPVRSAVISGGMENVNDPEDASVISTSNE